MRMLLLSDRAKPVADLPQISVYPLAQRDLGLDLSAYDAIVVDAVRCWMPQLLPTRNRNRDRVGSAVSPSLAQGKTVMWLVRDYFDCQPWLDNLGIDYDPDEATSLDWETPEGELNELISLASLRVPRSYLSFAVGTSISPTSEIDPLARVPGKTQPAAIHCRVGPGRLVVVPLFDVMDADTLRSLYAAVGKLTATPHH